jgi:hypothetical protein
MKAADLRDKSALPGSGCLKQEAEDLESRIPPRRSYENTAEFSEVCQNGGVLCPAGRYAAAVCQLPEGRRKSQEEEAYVLGMESYVYGFPLVIMDVSKGALTAASSPAEYPAPMNQFARATNSQRCPPRSSCWTAFWPTTDLRRRKPGTLSTSTWL